MQRQPRGGGRLALGIALLVTLVPGRGLFALDPKKPITQYRHDLWTVEDGLPQESINAIVQGPEGYLWLGTSGGVARFDGVRFQITDKATTPALRSNLVTTMLAARDGSLWLGTEGGGVTRLRDDTAVTYTTREGLLADVVFSLQQASDGAVWVGTQRGGLNRIAGGRVTTLSPRDGLPPHGVSSIAEAGGATWIGTFGGGLVRLAGGSLRVYTTADGLPHDSVRTLLRDRAGGLWIGTGGGLCRLEGESFRRYDLGGEASANVVRALREDADGSLWVGTDQGLVRLAGGAATRYATGDGLSSDVVTALLQDREGSLWVGTQAGLDLFRDPKLTTFTTREGLSSDSVRTVFVDPDGTTWIGTLAGLDRLRGRSVTTFTTRDGLSTDVVSAVLRDRAGTLWIGTRGGGLNALRDGRFTHYGPRDGLRNDSVRALYEDRGGALWIGTDGGGASRLQRGRFTTYTTREGLSSNFVRVFHQDAGGDLWIGTDGGGISRLRGGRFASYGRREGLPSSTVLAIHEEPDGGLLLGTYDGGLVRLRDGRFARCTARDGLLDDSVFDIEADSRGQLWMSSDRGVFRVDARELRDFFDGRSARVRSVAYDTRDGLQSSKCHGGTQPAGWRAADGRIWFATVRGAVSINPEQIALNAQRPPVLVEEVIADGLALPPGVGGSAGPGCKRVEIRYTAPSFVVPERVRFRYRLEGFDRDWIEAGAQRAAFYTNLPPGAYRFRVLAANDDGVWNTTGATYELSVEPFFHQRPVFYLLCALGVAAVVAAAVGLRLRQLALRQRELLALVEDRTRELRQANAEMEGVNVALREANELKTQLLGIAAHDLRNPLGAISGFAEIIRSRAEAGSRLAGQAAAICRASEGMLRLINDLLESVQIDSGRLEVHPSLVDLGELAQRVVAGHRAAAELKEQQLTVELPPEACLVEADAHRLGEAIENLVSNAIKYSPRGKPIRVSVGSGDAEATFAVRDEGPGISEEDRKRLFGRFQRLSATPTGGESSSGLGLSIARQLVELQGGRIWAESEEGKGSVFSIALPRHTSSRASASATGGRSQLPPLP
jgi:signal transduction histidine kinase/streptogramin lyase